jgi:predicted peptidase
MKKFTIINCFILSTLQFVFAAKTADTTFISLFEAHQIGELPYRLSRPIDFDRTKKYPVILSLHGAGGRGTDNKKQIVDSKWLGYLAGEEIRKNYASYILAPQSAGLWDEKQLDALKSVIKDLPSVDLSRIYVLGHSMGGHGTYLFIQFDPTYFAAAAPSAGSGLPETEDFIDVNKIKNIPIWAFHGDADTRCPYEKDQKVFESMKKVGGNMKFTTWKGNGHGTVSLKMFTGSDNGSTEMSSTLCDNETVFLKWLFNKKK